MTEKTQIHDTFIDVQIYFNLSMNFFDRCCKSLLGRWKRNRSWHKWTSRMSLVLKNFINNLFIMKSSDLSCDCLIGSTSRPYSKIGIHFVDTSWRITSSDAICPIFPKIINYLLFIIYILERVDLFHLQAANTVCVMTQVGVAKYVNSVLKPGLQTGRHV